MIMQQPANRRRWLWPALIVAVAIMVWFFSRGKPEGAQPPPSGTSPSQPVVANDVPLPTHTVFRSMPAPANPAPTPPPATQPAAPAQPDGTPAQTADKPETPKEPSLSEQAKRPAVIVKMVAPGAARGLQGNLDRIDAGRQRQADAVDELEGMP